jgi:hypothetical protein
MVRVATPTKGPQMNDTQTATVQPLYINDNGRVACSRHGGSYLTSALTARPGARLLPTPLGTWERFDAPDVVEYGLTCATCR